MAFYPAGGSAVTNLRGTGTSTLVGVGTVGDTNNRVELDADGGIRFGPGGAGALDATFARASAGLFSLNATLNAAAFTATTGAVQVNSGPLDIAGVGFGVQVKEGANAKQGTATLTAGTVVVANTSVTANSRIFLTGQVLGGTAGGLNVTSRVAGTSFTVTSTNAADTSTFAYEIFEPG